MWRSQVFPCAAQLPLSVGSAPFPPRISHDTVPLPKERARNTQPKHTPSAQALQPPVLHLGLVRVGSQQWGQRTGYPSPRCVRLHAPLC